MKKLVLSFASVTLLICMLYATFTAADSRKPIADFQIRVWLDRTEETIVLTCSEGCAWTKKVINCDADSACSAELHAYGSVEPARPE